MYTVREVIKMYNILVCDDDKEIVEAIEIYLSQEGYRILKAYDGIEALSILEKEKVDLLILDDFLLHTITDEREIKVLFEVMEKRSELSKCTIVCSQREPNSWASMILNDEVSANAILKRATKHYTVVIQPRN